MPRILHVQPHAPELGVIANAAAEILRGLLVAFPTETVYGLGANALDARAVAHIFRVKSRPAHDPLIVHLASVDDLPRVARDVPTIVHELACAFWPGPLTLLLPKQRAVPATVTAGRETVAVRIPAHPVALALLRMSDVPIAAPSANRFGHTSPTTAQHVLADLGDQVDLILDSGPTMVGVESTVLDVTRLPPLILRPGGVARETLEALIGPVDLLGEGTSLQPFSLPLGPLPSPGLLSKHYAPHAELILCMWEDSPVLALVQMAWLAQQKLAEGRQIGLLLADEDTPYFNNVPAQICSLGPADDLGQVAHNLFAGLRMLDEQGVNIILARDFGERGLGLAIRDRLRRAASQIILCHSQ